MWHNLLSDKTPQWMKGVAWQYWSGLFGCDNVHQLWDMLMWSVCPSVCLSVSLSLSLSLFPLSGCYIYSLNIRLTCGYRRVQRGCSTYLSSPERAKHCVLLCVGIQVHLSLYSTQNSDDLTHTHTHTHQFYPHEAGQYLSFSLDNTRPVLHESSTVQLPHVDTIFSRVHVAERECRRRGYRERRW